MSEGAAVSKKNLRSLFRTSGQNPELAKGASSLIVPKWI